MALRWTAAGMMEAKKGFRRLKAYKQLPTLTDVRRARQAARSATGANASGLADISTAASISSNSAHPFATQVGASPPTAIMVGRFWITC
jgi:hypothetical protein